MRVFKPPDAVMGCWDCLFSLVVGLQLVSKTNLAQRSCSFLLAGTFSFSCMEGYQPRQRERVNFEGCGGAFIFLPVELVVNYNIAAVSIRSTHGLFSILFIYV